MEIIAMVTEGECLVREYKSVQFFTLVFAL